MSAAVLVTALRDPASVAALASAGWTCLLSAARAEQLLGTLAHRLDGLALPSAAARVMADARATAVEQRRAALWEVEMARRALAPLGVPVVLLKGSAFVAAGLAAGGGAVDRRPRHLGAEGRAASGGGGVARVGLGMGQGRRL